MSAPRGRPPSARDSDGGGGITDWLPILGGVAIGAGLIALVYKLFNRTDDKNRCPSVNPAKRKWPMDKY